MPNICIFIINAQTQINNTNNRFVNDKTVIFTPSFLRRVFYAEKKGRWCNKRRLPENASI